MKTHIIDFRWVRPFWTHDGSACERMPLRLCAQIRPNGQGGRRVVDCCRCKAMELSPDLPVITMADLAFGNVLPGVAEEQRDEAARLFADNLRQEIPDAEIVCIIPDAASDFDLVAMRSQLMARFPSVDFLPASIGAVFDWEARLGRKVEDNELLIVADATPEGIQLTPVRAVDDKDAGRIVWERHPGKLVETDALRNMLGGNIKRSRYPAEFAAFPGWNGLASESGRLTLLCGGRWYELQGKSAGQFSGLPVDWKKLQPKITALARGLGKPGAAVLCATDFFRCTERDDPQICSCSPCIGAFSWAARQRGKPEISQWYDYLPELSMEVMRNGRFELFPLDSKENRRIEPRRGKRLECIIREPFTLPAGEETCSFPLSLGSGGNSSRRFTAEVHSRAFPLREKAECHLKLTYTYGAPEPYQLTFEGSFGTAYTTWQPVPDPDPDTPGPTPDIPRLPYGVEQLEDFAFKSKSSPDDTRKNLFETILAALTPLPPQAVVGTYVETRRDRKGMSYIRVAYNGYTLVCHAQEFYEPLPQDIQPDSPVYIARVDSKVLDDGRTVYSGKGVTFTAPLKANRSYAEKGQFQERNGRIIPSRRFSNKFFYPHEYGYLPAFFKAVYKHRAGNEDLPTWFTGALQSKIDDALRDADFLAGDYWGAEKILCALMCMGARAPEPVMQIVSWRVAASVKFGNSLPYDKYLHMLIGDMETKFQRGLFESVCRALGADNIYIRRSAQKVCANALRNRCLVNRLDCSTALAVFDAAHGALKACLNQENLEETIKNISFACRLLKLMLEFRNSNNTRIVAELCINSKRCAAVLETVKKLSNKLMDLGVPDMPGVHVVPAPSAYEGMYVPLYELHVLCSGSISARVTIEDGIDEDDADDLYDDD